MMKSSIAILILVMICITPLLPVSAQESGNLTIDAELRPRFEFRNGFKAPIEEEQNPAAFTEQRSRIYVHYQRERLGAQFTLQDVRIWGNHGQVYKQDPALTNVYEAWASYRFTDSWTLRAGRQAFNYDNARFLGNLDWAQQGRSHDALLFKYRPEGSPIQFDLAGTFNQAGINEPAHLTGNFYPIAGNNKSKQFAWFRINRDEAAISILVHNDGRQSQADSSVYWRQTFGVNGHRHFGDFTLRGDFYYQMGKDITGTGVNAFMIGAEAEYRMSPVTLSAGFDWLSGTGLDDTENRSFDPLYGTNHRYYGHMDYFYVGSPHRQPGNPYNTGLINIFQKFRTSLSSNLHLDVHLHEFISPVKIFDAPVDGNELGSYLGTEVDLLVTWQPQPDVGFIFGYSQIFATESMDRIKAVEQPQSIQNWAWVMLRFSPNLLRL